MLGNWLRQRILSATSGDILLGEAVTGFVGVDKIFTNDGKMFYSIEDGLNRETGIGTYVQAENKVVRTNPLETLIAGAYSTNVVTPMPISNEAIFSITGTVQSLTTHVPVWRIINGDFTHNANTGYLTPDVSTIAGNVESYTFRDDLVESLSVRFAVPYSISVGRPMYPHVKWSPNTADTGVVRWGIEFMIADIATGIFQDTITIYLEQAGSGTTNKHQMVDAMETIAAPLPDTLIIGRVFRDSTHINDTLVGNAHIHVAGFHYQADAIGTPQRTSDYYDWG